MSDKITIAISKGRIYDEAIPLLANIDIVANHDPHTSRRLILDTNQPNIQLLVVRATDVPTYVEQGSAALGIAGKDVLMEYASHDLYELLDLGIAKCRLVLAGRKNTEQTIERPRIATKYVNISKNYFADSGRQVEIIKLYGSMELAPLLGLSDWIIDLTDTGNTLRAHDLIVLENITDVSSKLIVNKAAMKMQQASIEPVLDKLSHYISNND